MLPQEGGVDGDPGPGTPRGRALTDGVRARLRLVASPRRVRSPPLFPRILQVTLCSLFKTSLQIFF